MIELLKQEHSDDDCKDKVFSLDEIKTLATEVVELGPNNWLCFCVDETWIKFAHFGFHHSDGDGKNVKVSCIYHGEGPSGSLRELRHVWWGEDGYTFYLPAKSVSKSLLLLERYVDLD